MPRIVTIIFVFMLFATLQAVEERRPHFTQIDESLSVDVSAVSGNERVYIDNFFTCLNRRVKRFFPENRRASTRASLPVRILFSPEKGKKQDGIIVLPTKKHINIYLPETFLKTPGCDDGLMNSLIAAMILAEGGRIPTGKAAIPYWLSTGITESVSFRSDNPIANSFRIYPDLHNLLCNGGNIKLSTLISAPPESYDPKSATLFRESAEILVKELSMLKYKGENPFLEMAILYSRTDVNDHLTAFNASFREQLLAEKIKAPDEKGREMTDREKAEVFFSSKLSKYALGYFLPASPEMSEKTFQSLLQVQLGSRTFDIEKLPLELQQLKDPRQKDAIFLELKISTMDQANFIAPELRPPLNTLRLAIFRFAAGESPPEEFLKSVKEARTEFNAKLQKLKQTDSWLASLEAAHGMSQEIRRSSGIVKKLDEMERNARPGLNGFLDETEKKFGN